MMMGSHDDHGADVVVVRIATRSLVAASRPVDRGPSVSRRHAGLQEQDCDYGSSSSLAIMCVPSPSPAVSVL